MNRYDFYFEQLVTEAQMDQSFSWSEEADWEILRLAVLGRISDVQPRGAIHYGAKVNQNASPDLNVLVSAGGCTDPTGRHVGWDSTQTVDCSVDYLGAATDVVAAPNEKYLGIFALWDRELTDPKSDGNGLPIFFQQFDSFVLRVVQGTEAPAGTASPPNTPSDAIRLANVKLAYGQTQILDADILFDIPTYFRDDFVHVVGTNLPAFSWGNPSDAIADVFQLVDSLVTGVGIAFTGTQNWADSTGLSSGTVSGAINEIVADLALDVGADGAGKIGSDEYDTGGTFVLAQGTVRSQLRQLADGVEAGVLVNSPETITAPWEFNVTGYAGTNVDALLVTGKGGGSGILTYGGAVNGWGIKAYGGVTAGGGVRGEGASSDSAAGRGGEFYGGSTTVGGNGATGAYMRGGEGAVHGGVGGWGYGQTDAPGLVGVGAGASWTPVYTADGVIGVSEEGYGIRCQSTSGPPLLINPMANPVNNLAPGAVSCSLAGDPQFYRGSAWRFIGCQAWARLETDGAGAISYIGELGFDAVSIIGSSCRMYFDDDFSNVNYSALATYFGSLGYFAMIYAQNVSFVDVRIRDDAGNIVDLSTTALKFSVACFGR